MKLLVLRVAAVEEIGILPLVVEQDVTRQRFDHRAALSEPGRAMVDAGVHDSPTRNESAPGAKVFADSREHVTQTEFLSVAREYPFPERRVPHHPTRLVKAPRRLERCTVHIAEYQPAVHVRHAIVIVAEYSIGVRDAKARLTADVALRPDHVVDRALLSRRRQGSVVRRRQHPDSRAPDLSRQLERCIRLHDASRVNQIVGRIERVQSFQKERTLLRKEQRLPRIDHELARV
jgi:hypothetical protein